MAMNQVLRQLMPRGKAWPMIGSVWGQLLDGLAVELQAVSQEMEKWARELCPIDAGASLEMWERALGLPDSCDTVQGDYPRQGAVLARIAAEGGQTPAYYVQQAAWLGYPAAAVTELLEFTCEDAVEGFLWEGASYLDMSGTVESPLEVGSCVWVWLLHLGISPVVWLTCEDEVGNAIQSWGSPAAECYLRRLVPAHTLVVFTYEVDDASN